MGKISSYATVLATALLVVSALGCASTAMPPVDLAKADCGAYPQNYEELVKGWFQSQLKDPYSAQYRFSKPYKAYLRAAPIAGGKPMIFGYIVDVQVNAKNSFGGYIGEKPYRFFIRDGRNQGPVYANTWFSEPWYR